MHSKAPPIKPFLKWAGNKYRIIEQVQSLLPQGNRLVEPFVGSGAVFLNTAYQNYLLTDSNQDLIDLYNLLKQDGNGFIKYCQRLFTPENNSAEAYYRLRDEFNQTRKQRRKAALFLFLNRHGYNGLCRYNAKGGFNVPFGRYKKPYFPKKEMLQFHLKAQNAEFRQNDFTQTISCSRLGDVIYCDPPYVPLSNSANFTSYSAGGFGQEQQSLLAALAEQSIQRSIPVLISNHNTRFTRKAYTAAREIKKFNVRRQISCNSHQRGNASELLALFIK